MPGKSYLRLVSRAARNLLSLAKTSRFKLGSWVFDGCKEKDCPLAPIKLKVARGIGTCSSWISREQDCAKENTLRRIQRPWSGDRLIQIAIYDSVS